MSAGKRRAADFLAGAATNASAAVSNAKRVKANHVPASATAAAPLAAPISTMTSSTASSEGLAALLYPNGRKPTSELTPFQRRVYALTRRIPAGHVSTYKHLAISLNCPRAYRAVGNALRHNPFAPQVPCHRVLASDGSIGGFAGSTGVCALTSKKISMLQAEGIRFESDGRSISKEQAYRNKVIMQHIDAAGIEQAISDEQLSSP